MRKTLPTYFRDKRTGRGCYRIDDTRRVILPGLYGSRESIEAYREALVLIKLQHPDLLPPRKGKRKQTPPRYVGKPIPRKGPDFFRYPGCMEFMQTRNYTENDPAQLLCRKHAMEVTYGNAV